MRQGAARLELADTEVSALVDRRAVVVRHDRNRSDRADPVEGGDVGLERIPPHLVQTAAVPTGRSPHLDRPIEIGATDADTTECLAVVVRPDVEIVLRNRLRRQQLGDAADAGVVSVGGEFGGDLELEPASAKDLRNHGRVGDDEDTAHVEHDGIDVLGQDHGPE